MTYKPYLRIVGRSNPVTRQWLSHILINGVVLRIPKFIMVRKEVTGELTRKNSDTREIDSVAFSLNTHISFV